MVATRRAFAALILALTGVAMFGALDRPERGDVTKAAVVNPPIASRAAGSPGGSMFVSERREATPRLMASSLARAHSDPPRTVFAIVPLDPQVGFVVDAEALDWLPRSLDLRAGDAVLEIDNEPVVSTGQLLQAVRGTSEGSAVEL